MKQEVTVLFTVRHKTRQVTDLCHNILQNIT